MDRRSFLKSLATIAALPTIQQTDVISKAIAANPDISKDIKIISESTSGCKISRIDIYNKSSEPITIDILLSSVDKGIDPKILSYNQVILGNYSFHIRDLVLKADESIIINSNSKDFAYKIYGIEY